MSFPVAGPQGEPVTLAEARAQCRVDSGYTAEDARLESFIAAAREMAEHETGQRFITQTWSETLDAWPAAGCIFLPQTPAREILSIKYLDNTATEQTVPPQHYRLVQLVRGAGVRLLPGQSWPSGVLPDSGAITVLYKVGMGDTPAAVPAGVREWILAHVASMWENRGVLGAQGADFAVIPYLARLLDASRVYA